LIEPFVVHGVVSGNHKHALDPVAHSLLTKRHLKDSVLDRFAGHLTTELVQLAMRDLEIGRGVFMLTKIRHVDEASVEEGQSNVPQLRASWSLL
jgi:hypothetical protein